MFPICTKPTGANIRHMFIYTNNTSFGNKRGFYATAFITNFASRLKTIAHGHRDIQSIWPGITQP